MTTYTVVNARGRTVLPASDAATAALNRQVFDDKHGQDRHRVVPVEPETRTPVLAPLSLAVLLALPLLAAGAGAAWAGSTERVSIGTDGRQGDGDSGNGGLSITPDGRYVAFSSYATFGLGGTNHTSRIFVRDRLMASTELVSASSSGDPGNGNSDTLSISPDGRYVVFASVATNLVPNDNNGEPDIFIRDRETGRTDRISLSPSGIEGNGASFHPTLSADSHYIAFCSNATNLLSRDANGSKTDVLFAIYKQT